MKVVVLGCGPAGLMAMQAAVDACRDAGLGLNGRIFSRKQKSSLYGAQYLHRPIPGVTPGDGQMVHYRMLGDTDGYRRKVYGRLWDGKVSPEDLGEDHLAWDIRATYDELWNRWKGFINDVDLDPVWLHRFLEPEVLKINTVPLDSLCYQEHAFGFTEIIAAGDAPDLGIKIPYGCEPFTVKCNGDEAPAWYRISNVFGHKTVEWPGSISAVPINSAARVRKPTTHNCDCWPSMMCVGRYGAWKKGVLSHSAYFDTYQKIIEVSRTDRARAEA